VAWLSRIWQVWLSGGWVMIPLFVLAVLLYAQAFQLVMYLRRTDLRSDDEMQWWGWVRSPDEAKGRVAGIIRYTQTDVSSAKQVRNRFEEIRLALIDLIDRRARFVSTLVTAAPLLGLLGTVLGMLKTFFGISTGGGAETADVVAGGIAEALVTTEAGLMIALPGLFMVMMIQRQRHGLEAKLARLESLTLTYLRFE
jgi:biopolymer transport protein ExbB